MRAVMGVAMTGATRPLPCPLPSDGMLMQLPQQQLRQRLWVHAQIRNACSPAGCVCVCLFGHKVWKSSTKHAWAPSMAWRWRALCMQRCSFSSAQWRWRVGLCLP